MTPSFSEPFNLYYKLAYSQLVADLLVKLVKWMFTLKMYHLYTNVMLKTQLQPGSAPTWVFVWTVSTCSPRACGGSVQFLPVWKLHISLFELLNLLSKTAKTVWWPVAEKLLYTESLKKCGRNINGSPKHTHTHTQSGPIIDGNRFADRLAGMAWRASGIDQLTFLW